MGITDILPFNPTVQCVIPCGGLGSGAGVAGGGCWGSGGCCPPCRPPPPPRLRPCIRFLYGRDGFFLSEWKPLEMTGVKEVITIACPSLC